MAFANVKIPFTAQPIWQQVLIVFIFNSIIAIFLHAIIPNSILSNQLIMSHSIGFSILSCYLALGRIFELKSWRILIPLIIGSPIGISIAILIQAISTNASFDLVVKTLRENYLNILSSLFIALFFGFIIVAFFIYRERIHKDQEKLQAEKINNLNNQKTIAESNLRMLQAQIEPHFLFNTLSNIISLIETEPDKSRHLLESLTEFLRATLKRSTDKQQELHNEICLIRHYLKIMKLRIGKRLDYNIHVQNDLDDCVFPPLLLQPLVENAIIHGVEPLTEGGKIDINISKRNGKLLITVSDSGKGLSTDSISGFGLSNIRDRIQLLYNEDGHLFIEDNQPSGVIATIEIPYDPL